MKAAVDRAGPSARSIIGRVLIAALIAGVFWLIGLDLANALTVGVFCVALFGLRTLVPGEVETWPPEPEAARNTGARRDVARLSWGLQGQDARVDRWSVRRLRALAAHRMAIRGLDLDAPEDSAACRRILGRTTYDALNLDPNDLPRFPTFVAALDAIERLSQEESPR